MPKSSEARKLEHINSSQNPILFDGTLETLPYRSGDEYEGRTIIAVGFVETVYGPQYSLVVEGDDTHVKTRFTFDQKHDLVFVKPLETAIASSLKSLNIPNIE